MTFLKNVQSHKKCQVCWMSIEILASKLPVVMGTYRHLSHTAVICNCIVSCVKIFDVGDRDLPVPTSGNWVIRGCMTKWFLKCFYVFWKSRKTWLFTFFRDVAHVFSNSDLRWRLLFRCDWYVFSGILMRILKLFLKLQYALYFVQYFY